MVLIFAGGGFGPSMQLRSCVSRRAHPWALKPEEAQQAVRASVGTRSEYVWGDAPRTVDMIAMQGFCGVVLGWCTRRVLRGGRRMGFWPTKPDMMAVAMVGECCDVMGDGGGGDGLFVIMSAGSCGVTCVDVLEG